MKTEALERYKEIAENIYRKYPNISDKGLSFYLLKDLQKAGFDPNQRRNPDGTWGAGGSDEKCSFDNWFKDSKTVNGNGTPKVFYHGTTHGFTEFSNVRGNPENDFGIGFYFSNSIEDVQANYDEVDGADLRMRIAGRMEEIMSGEDWTQEISDNARVQATSEISGGESRVISVYLSVKNPVVVGAPIFHAEEQETQFNYDYNYETGEESGNIIELADALRAVAVDYENVEIQTVINDAIQASEFNSEASVIIQAMRHSDGLVYSTDGNGHLAGHELIRSAFEYMGFDGIIDNTVWNKFGIPGTNMQGMDEMTQHVIAFEPNQIKRTDAESFCPDSDDIRKNIKAGFQQNQIRDAQGRWTETGGSMKKFEQEIKKNDFESAGVYDKDGNEIFTKKGGASTVQFSDKERKLMRDAVLTHNHPGNSSFSHSDITFLFSTGLTDIRAINSQGFTFTMNKAADYGDIFAKFGRNPIQLINTAFNEATIKINEITENKMFALIQKETAGVLSSEKVDDMISELSGNESHLIWEEVANTEFGRFALKYTKQ